MTAQKIFSILTSFNLIVQLALGSLLFAPNYSFAQEVTPSPVEETVVIETPLTEVPAETIIVEPMASPEPACSEPVESVEGEPTPEPTMANPTAEPTGQILPEASSADISNIEILPVPTPSLFAVGKECLAGQEIEDAVNEDWNVDLEKGLAETKEKVKLGVKYNFPLESKVSIAFKCLPKDEGLRTSLKIQQIRIADLKLPGGVSPAGEYAYDITTSMKDGDFEYDVTLPKEEGKDAKMSYMEEVNGELKAVGEDKTNQEGSVVKVVGLDHFTIFIATYSDNTFSVDKSVYQQGETVYIKSTDLDNKKYYRIDLFDPDNVPVNVFSCAKGNTGLEKSYVLSSGAKIGTGWRAEIKKYDKNNDCSDDKNREDLGSDDFEVVLGVVPTPTVITAPNLVLSASWNCVNDSAGANDEPGQKDLTRMCSDYTGLPNSIQIKWGWDEIAWSGNNSGDACSLYDTDGDGFANYSLCVVVKGSPANYDSKVLYSCGDSRPDRCTNPIVVQTPGAGTFCTASVYASDPFPAGYGYPNDTVAECTIALSDVGGVGVANLIDVCSYPSQQPNSDPSDCILYRSRTGKLEVRKVLNPSGDSGLFNLQIDGATEKSDAGNGGTTGEKIVSAGSHTVGETAGTATNLSNYSSSISCKNLNGTGTEIARAENSGPLSVSVADGEDIVCTITNSQMSGTLIVRKVLINDNGGTKIVSDFSFSVNSAAAVGFEADGQNDLTVSAGTYTVTEPAVAGYSTSYDNCDRVSVPAGGSATCTITNDDRVPRLTLVKTVVNNNGGTKQVADFPLFINGNPAVSGVAYDLLANIEYTASETNQAGYSPSVWGGDCSSNGKITLSLGDNKTCTITNDDQPAHLIVVKHVDNSHGGTAVAGDFTMTINGVTAVGGNSFPGQENPGTDKIVNPGTYSVSETGLDGYSGLYSTDCSGTIALGQTKTCTVTNGDQPATLKVIKHVVNNNGGTAAAGDFTMNVTGTNVSLSSFPGSESGIFVTLDAGSYSVDEDSFSGYSKSLGANCSGAIAIGQAKTCTLTNDDQPSQITACKYDDLNANGKKDENENGIYGVAMTLQQYGEGWQNTATGDTDEDGCYLFENLSAGRYRVIEDLQDSDLIGYSPTDGLNGVSPEYNLPLGGKHLFEFLNVKYASVGDFVWSDVNDNNVQDPGEPGLTGVTVKIYEDTNLNGVYDEGIDLLKGTTITDGIGGSYLFTGLIAGTYFILVDTSTLPAGYSLSEGGENPQKTILLPGANDLDRDFGFAPQLSLSLVKTNNKSVASAGDLVTYTLTVTVGPRSLSSMTLLDNLPEGFIYQTGTATVSGGTVNSVEPTLSNGNKTLAWTWSFVPGSSTVTVAYQTKIDSGNQAASYTNFAYVYGSGSPTSADSDIVDSVVRIDPQISHSSTVGGEVLGAETELPASGSNTWYLFLALSLIGTGFVIKKFNRKFN